MGPPAGTLSGLTNAHGRAGSARMIQHLWRGLPAVLRPSVEAARNPLETSGCLFPYPPDHSRVVVTVAEVVVQRRKAFNSSV